MNCNGCYQKRSEAAISALNISKKDRSVKAIRCAECDGWRVIWNKKGFIK